MKVLLFSSIFIIAASSSPAVYAERNAIAKVRSLIELCFKRRLPLYLDGDRASFVTDRSAEELIDLYKLRYHFGQELLSLRNKKILDIGGGFSSFAKDLSFDYGISWVKQVDWWYSADEETLEALNGDSISLEDKMEFIETNANFLLTGTAQNLPIEDNSLDLVTSSNVFMYFAQREEGFREAIREVYRVLKPGGMAIIVPLHPQLRSWAQDELSKLGAAAVHFDQRDTSSRFVFRKSGLVD